MKVFPTLRRTILILLCLFCGAAAGGIAVAYFGGRMLTEARADDNAGLASYEAEALGCLRLGEIDKARQLLESDMDHNVLRVLQHGPSVYRSTFFPPTPRQADLLLNVKIYRTAYPTTRPVDPLISKYFATVPVPTIAPECNAAICRIGRSLKPKAAHAGAAP